jgi:predicted nuclease of predicted toxin-antitoxin system
MKILRCGVSDRQKELPGVMWLRIGNTRKAELLRWFESLLPDAIAALESGEQLIEVD